MDTKRIARRLKKKCRTSDPFEIAQAFGIIVLFEPLGDIRGYYNCCYRTRFIHISSFLSEAERRFVCAHELAHALLHPKIHTNFLLTHTNVELSKLENEANRFAVDLLFDDSDLIAYLSVPIETAAAALEISIPLATYRLGSVKDVE